MANQTPLVNQIPRFTAVQTSFAIHPLPQGVDALEPDQFTTPDNNPVRTLLAFIAWTTLPGIASLVECSSIIGAISPALRMAPNAVAALRGANILEHELTAAKLSTVVMFLANAGVFNQVFDSQKALEVALIKLFLGQTDTTALQLGAFDFIISDAHVPGAHAGLDTLAITT